jgi:arylformamidase
VKGAPPAIDPGWRDWPLARLEREYSPSSRVAAIDPLLDAYAARSAEARAAHAWFCAGYGDCDDERVDVFPAAAAGPEAGGAAPIVVFFHGGYWQQLGRGDASFGATQFVPRGVAWAAPGYTLAPRATLAAIVAQCRRAVRWVLANAVALNVDPHRVWLAGSSAGAHLAAMAMLDPLLAGGARPAGAFLLSGIYDLRPLVPTYVNGALALDDAQARALSPLAVDPADLARFGTAVLAVGEHETDSFQAQSRAFAAALGQREPPIEEPGRNHFDLVFALGDPSTRLGATVHRLIAGDAAPN